MSTRTKTKFILKLARRQMRRAAATLQHGSLSGTPLLFANSFPKSGTHLLTQVLQGFTQISPAVESGLPAIVTFDGPTGQPRPVADILRDLRRLRPGDIAYGHLHALPEVVAHLTEPGAAPFFILRDPRDVVVSHVHYVTEMEPNHVHHAHYRHELTNFDERLRTSISGLPDLAVPFPDIRGRFDPYMDWLDAPAVLVLHYEDFITHREQTLLKVLNHARSRGLKLHVGEQEALRVLESAIDPARSPTFRSGKIGKWSESFSDANKSLFKDVAGDLLIRLGYEQNNDW